MRGVGDLPVRIDGLDEAAIAALLAERQRRYGTRDDAAAGESRRLILWSIGAERFALPLEDVAGVAPMPRVTRVPGAPAPLIGVFAQGGVLHNLFDPSALLGASAAAEGERMVLILRHERCLALAIDRAEAIQDVDAALAVSDTLTHFIAGGDGPGCTLISLPHLVQQLLGGAGRLEG